MASLYTIARSPFWYLQFTEDGRRRNKSTGLRHDNESETSQARILRAKWEAKELTEGAPPKTEGWDWVHDFIASTSENANTRRRYLKAWEWIGLFLSRAGLNHPNQIRFKHGQAFATFRSTFKKRTGKVASINTSRQEAKIFSLIMSRAVQLELAQGNPLVRMKLPKTDPPEKPAITPQEFALILPALESEPEWMRLAFLISMHTGCRLRETRLPLSCVDFARRTITFPCPKGGRKKAFTRPLPDELLPVLWPVRAREFTLDFPFQPSRRWGQFFQKLHLDHLCFHCLRVTYVSLLAKTGVPLSVAMRLVNHASETIHRIYQRLGVEDVRAYAGQIHVPVAASAPGASPQSLGDTPAGPSPETHPAAPTSLRCRKRLPAPRRAL